ncbi:MAG: SDR family NAD(P)-dependent oxidoreductase [Anaerolineae bacterium]|nr:SDR family NAD(P)-dependent oxidoreductase [Anaerolineae bacterium]
METTKNTVLITGGSSGIGLALAKRFWQEKNDVIIVGRNAAKLAQVQAMLPGIKTECLDVSDVAALEQLPQRHPQVNILINNAGVQYNYDFSDPTQPLDLIEAEINTNVLGPLYLTKLFIPQLSKHKEAAIINVSSGLGFVPKQSAPVYCGSKAALHIFTKSLRWQLESTPIKVFEIIPALVETSMTQGRGHGKISPEELVDEFWRSFKGNHTEVRIGKIKQLLWLNKLVPNIAEKIMRAS